MNYPISYEKNHYNLLLMFYPRYDVLKQEMTKFFYRGQLVERGLIDLYIDLNSMVAPVISRNDYVSDDPLSIASSIINIAAHMRNFYATRYGIYTRIYLIYGNTRPDSAAAILPDYNAHFAMEQEAKSYIRDMVEENMKYVDMIVKYIPNVYFISSKDTEPGVLIRSTMKIVAGFDKANPKLNGCKIPRYVLSKDSHTFQVAATCNSTHIIRPKKTNVGDITSTMSYFDFYSKFVWQNNLKTKIGIGISPELYSMYLALAGCRNRYIRGIMNYNSADKLIHSLISSGIIINGYNIRPSVDPSFATEIGLDPSAMFTERFNVIDILHQEILFSTMPSYHNIKSSLVDMYDPEAVKDINNRYFRKYPLDLNAF